jgi:3-oxoacyl-[acyl-carrier protein] reductase
MTMIDPGLQDAVVIITGANNPVGIGAATARAFAAQGARLFLNYYRVPQPATDTDGDLGESQPGAAFYRAQSAKSADEVLASVTELGATAHAWEADLARPDAITDLFDAAEATLGPVQVLVNNAAHWEADTFVPAKGELTNRMVEMWTDRPQTIRAGSFDRTFAANARAVALSMAEFARRHVARGGDWGRIINLSTDGARCFPSEVSYGASKLTLEGYTRSAAVELGRYGITANIISPGPIQTGWITLEMEREILNNIPLGRIGYPEDVADVILFLASTQARWVTGQTIHVGGGHRV